MDDLISRQEALEKVRAMKAYKLFEDIILVDKAEVQTELMMLPTIQPEKAQLSKEGATKDTISRQAAIDAIVNCTNCGDEKTLRAYVAKHSLDNGWTGGVLEAIDAIKDLPPAQPEPQWILITERLPRDGTWNIFTDGKNISAERYKADAIDHFFPNGRWFQLEDVIAWMPLPEAYKPNK